jgi:hypothetical protein
MLGSLFYLVNSPTRMVAAVLNCFFGALTVVFAYRIARTLFSEWVASRVGWWTCLLPSLIVWSAQTVKEPVVIFLETLALYGCVNLKRSGFSVRHVVLCAVTAILVIPFRFYVAYIVAGTIVFSLLLPHLTRRKMSIGSALVVALVFVPLLFVTGVLIRHESRFDRFDAKHLTRSRVSTLGIHDCPQTFTAADQRVDSAQCTLGSLSAFTLSLGTWRSVKSANHSRAFVWWWLVVVALIRALYTVRKRFSDAATVVFSRTGSALQRDLRERRFSHTPESSVASMVGYYRHGGTRTARIAEERTKASVFSTAVCAKTPTSNSSNDSNYG